VLLRPFQASFACRALSACCMALLAVLYGCFVWPCWLFCMAVLYGPVGCLYGPTDKTAHPVNVYCKALAKAPTANLAVGGRKEGGACRARAHTHAHLGLFWLCRLPRAHTHTRLRLFWLRRLLHPARAPPASRGLMQQRVEVDAAACTQTRAARAHNRATFVL